MIKKKLLVCLGIGEHIEKTKQVFYSALNEGQWRDEMMLLTLKDQDDNKLKWFKDRNILISQQERINHESDFFSILLTKFYLFTKEFKKWNKILYLDSDVIIRGNLNHICQLEGDIYFASGGKDRTLEWDFKKPKTIKIEYDLSKAGFNAGVFWLDTKIIKKTSFKELMDLTKRFSDDIKIISADQGILNLYFYDRWTPFPEKSVIQSSRRNVDLYLEETIYHFAGGTNPWEDKAPDHLRKIWEKNNMEAQINMATKTI